MENFKKYPRTFHLPWSQALTSDDKLLKSLSVLEKSEVIVTLKMDGENTSMYHNGIHARSMESKHHWSRNWVKQLQGQLAHLIPESLRICGENLYGKHSIGYDNLPSYFMVFSIWEGETCWDWDKTVAMAQNLGLEMVPVIYRGKFDKKSIEAAFKPYANEHEGYVVRVTGEIAYSDFDKAVGKFVRQNHVQTDKHWMTHSTIKNNLKD